MCECSDNQPKCMRHTTRKARVAHLCYECDVTIRPGDLYVVISGVWDGGPASFAYCDSCATIERLACSAIPGFCYTFGSLNECVSECLRGAA